MFVYFQAGITLNVALILAVFTTFPLKFEGMLEIDKRVSKPDFHQLF